MRHTSRSWREKRALALAALWAAGLTSGPRDGNRRWCQKHAGSTGRGRDRRDSVHLEARKTGRESRGARAPWNEAPLVACAIP